MLLPDVSTNVQFEDRIAILNQIKSCRKEWNVSKMKRIHARMHQTKLFPQDVYLATALLSAYAERGHLVEAKHVFEQLPVHTVVSWNALISGYVQHGFGCLALQCFRQMQDEGVSPNAVTYICIVRACGTDGSVEMGEEIEAEVRKAGLLGKNIVIGNAMISMYMKCGALEKGHKIFEELPARDTITWTALMAGYAQHGLGDEALRCFRQMQDEGILPNAVSYICALKACGMVGCIKVGEAINIAIRKGGLLREDVRLGTALVDMYAKCGSLEKAHAIFKELPIRNVACWNVLISGYSQHGFNDEALKCFREMQTEGVSPNPATYIYVLQICGSVGCLEIGEEIGEEAKKRGFLRKEVALGTALLGMYAKCGMLEKARDTFQQLPFESVVSWNALIAGYVKHGFAIEALECFRQMQEKGFSADAVTYICILKAYGMVGSLEGGDDIVSEVTRQGLEQKDIVLGNTMIETYAKCGALKKAREVFDQLPVRNVVSWTVLIAGYAQHKLHDDALECFKQMQEDGFSPDTVTYMCVLKVCGSIRSLEIGQEIDVLIRKQGLLQKDVVLGSALIDMYAKCGALNKAQEVFDQLPMQTSTSWTVLIAGYAQHNLLPEALRCLKQMQDKKVPLDAISYTCIAKSCGIIGSLDSGEEIDANIRKQGLLHTDIVLGNTLVAMYARCGAPNKGKEVFEQLPVHDIISWNALMAGYGKQGNASMVLGLFRQMKRTGVIPDLVTFLVLLTACGHAGLVNDGEIVFNRMYVSHRLAPNLEHYTCMIDLFSRAGHFYKARTLLDKVSSSEDLPLFVAILCACQKWRNVELARWAQNQVLQLDEKSDAAYLCMENMYATFEIEIGESMVVS